MKILAFILYLVFSIGGSTFLKIAGDNTNISFESGLSFHMEWKAILGFAMYVVSFLIWTRLITKYEISVMVPILTGISQICFLIVGNLVFKEQLNAMSLIGAAVIIAGIMLLAFGMAH